MIQMVEGFHQPKIHGTKGNNNHNKYLSFRVEMLIVAASSETILLSEGYILNLDIS